MLESLSFAPLGMFFAGPNRFSHPVGKSTHRPGHHRLIHSPFTAGTGGDLIAAPFMAVVGEPILPAGTSTGESTGTVQVQLSSEFWANCFYLVAAIPSSRRASVRFPPRRMENLPVLSPVT